MKPKPSSSNGRTNCCADANPDCDVTRTKLSHLLQPIQANNKSSLSVLATMNLTLSGVIIYMLAMPFTHSINGSLRRLDSANDQRSPQQQCWRIHRSNNPGIPLV